MFFLKFLFPTSGIISSLIQFFSSVIPKLFDVLQPLWVTLIEFLKWYISQFWSGLTAIIHNLTVLAVIAPLLLFTSGYVQWKEEKECKQELTTIRQEYMFVKRQKKLVKQETKVQEWDPLKSTWKVIDETLQVFK